MYKSKSTFAIIGIVAIFIAFTFSQNNSESVDKSSITISNVADHVDKKNDVNDDEVCNIPFNNSFLFSHTWGLCQTNEIPNEIPNELPNEITSKKLSKRQNYSYTQKRHTRFRLSRLLGLGTTICNILLMKLQRRSHLLLIFVTSVSMSLLTIFV